MSGTAERGEGPVAGEVPTELRRVMGPRLLLLFIIGGILGTGVYALIGEVGGGAWVPFLVAFGIATISALSYLELVTAYPRRPVRRCTPTGRSGCPSSPSSWRSP